MKLIKYIIKMLLLLLLFIAVGYLALVAVYMIPLHPIKENLGKSYQLLETEGTWRKLVEWHDDTMLDNWTDSTILIETGYDYSQPAYQAALLVPECSVGYDNPTDSFIKIYRQDDNLEIREWNYVNYWHGYLIFMKPLMTIMTYGQIRYLNQFLQTLLMGTIFALLGYRKKLWYAFPIALTYIFLNPAVVSMSIQYNTMFMITFLQILFILLRNKGYEKRELWAIHFFIVGCLTSYFDFLTYPIIGYGIPFVLLISLYPLKFKEDLKNFIKTGIAWCAGYVGMWSGKWILGTILTEENILKQAVERVLFRSRGNIQDVAYFDIIKRNFDLRKDVIYVSILFLIICLIYLLVKKMKICINHIYIFTAIIPFAWYYMAANHSYEHYFFTYRNLSIVIISITLMGAKAIEMAKIKKD